MVLGVDLTWKKMLSGRRLTVKTNNFEDYLVFRYKRLWIMSLWSDLSLNEGGGLERDFFKSLGVLIPCITFVAECECAGRKVGCGKGWFEVLVRTDFGSITLNCEG